MKEKIFIHITHYNNLYQILINIIIWIMLILFMLDKNIVLAEEISETHQKLRNMIIEETYRDFYGIEYTIEGGPYKRPNIEDIFLTDNFYGMQYKLIDNIFDDYLTKSYLDSHFYDYYGKPVPKCTQLSVADIINTKSPATRLAYCIKAENIYYLTEFEKSELRSMLANYSTMEPIVKDAVNDMLTYGYYNPRIIPITPDLDFEFLISDLQYMKIVLGDRPFISHFSYDLVEQELIYNICKEGTIPKEKLLEYFKSMEHSILIDDLKTRIFGTNSPF